MLIRLPRKTIRVADWLIKMAAVQTNFSLKLFSYCDYNSSTILSPISISLALAMVYLGAKKNEYFLQEIYFKLKNILYITKI
jgi:serine protease inhibitor